MTIFTYLRVLILFVLIVMQCWFVLKAGKWVTIEWQMIFLGAACYGKEAIDLFKEMKGGN